jgi:hypothetical protein
MVPSGPSGIGTETLVIYGARDDVCTSVMSAETAPP